MNKLFFKIILIILTSLSTQTYAQGWKNSFAIEHEKSGERNQVRQASSRNLQNSSFKTGALRQVNAVRGESFSGVWDALEQASVAPATFAAVQATDNSSTELEIVAQALDNDFNKILRFVMLEIKNEPYYGLKKSPLMTLFEKSGNDYDKTALAIALLDAANLGSYYYGKYWMEYSTNPSDSNSIQKWLGIGSGSAAIAESILDAARIPYINHFDEGNRPILIVSRIFLSQIWGGDYDMTDVVKAFTVGENIPVNVASLLSAATSGATTSTYGISRINEANIDTKIKELASTITDNAQNVEKTFKIINGYFSETGSVAIKPFNYYNFSGVYYPATFNSSLYGSGTRFYDGYSIIYDNPPESEYAYMQFYRGGKDVAESALTKAKNSSNQDIKLKLSQLNGERIWASFTGNNFYINKDDSPIHSWTGRSAGNVKFKTEIISGSDPIGIWYSEDERKESITNVIVQANQSIYNIAYIGTPSKNTIIRAKRESAKAMREAAAQGYADEAGNFIFNGSNSFEDGHKRIVSHCLNILALEWMQQTYTVAKTVGRAYSCDFFYSTRLGRTAQEYSPNGSGFFIDVGVNTALPISSNGNFTDMYDSFKLASIYNSALEHTIIQQLQNQKEAISTVNVFHYANSANMTLQAATYPHRDVLGNLFAKTSNHSNGYSDSELLSFKVFMDENPDGIVVAPQLHNVQPSGWDWKGGGHMMISNSRVAMIISGGYNGGYSPNYNPISYPAINDFNSYSVNIYSQSSATIYTPPVSYNMASFTIPKITGVDPVDMYSGAYLYDVMDIAKGSSLSLTRSYNSNAASDAGSGFGYGWTHNFNITLSLYGDSDITLNPNFARDNAYFLASVYAAKAVLADLQNCTNNSQKARNLAIVCMIAGKGVDSILDNSVSIKAGTESFAFKKKYKKVVNGSNVSYQEYYEAPTGTNLKLEKIGSNDSEQYVMTEPYGNIWTFNKYNESFKIGTIKDIYGKGVTFNYSTGDDLGKRLMSVADSYGNNLTFTWYTSNGSPRITSVSDGTRSVNYEYSTSTVPHNLTGINGRVLKKDLIKAVDVLDNPWLYAYDSQSLMTELTDGNGDVVVSNFYDANNVVWKQYSCGDPQRVWKVSVNGENSFEISPLGHVTRYDYDDRGMPIAKTDANGNVTKSEYDNYARLTKTIMPNGDEARTTYDTWHNKLSEDVYEKTDMGFVWKSGVVYTYESNTGTDVPRLLSVTKRNAENSTTGRTSTIDSYLMKGTVKTNTATKATDEKGVSQFFDYDAQGRLTQSGILSGTSKIRITTYSQYDSHDRPGKIVGPDGIEKMITYNQYGDIAVTTTAGLTETFEYDLKRRVVRTHLSGVGISQDIVAQTFYDAADNVIKTIDTEGLESTATWTSQKKHLTQTVGTGVNAQTVTYEYDLADRLIKEIAPDDTSVTLTLDPVGQTVASTELGKMTSMEYDNLGRNTKTTSPMGISVSYSYDALDNKITTTDGRGNVIRYTYNTFGEETSITNRRGHTFSMGLDIVRCQSTLTTPTGKTGTIKYSQATWAPVATIPASGEDNQSTMTYDSAGRLSKVSDSLGDIDYTYNATNGLLQKIVENTDEIVYAHDTLGRITSSTADNLSVSYNYTSGGNIASITYPIQNGISAKTVNYVYDDLGRLQKIIDWNNRETVYAYDNMNRLTSITRPNGSTRMLTYDALTGLVSRIIERKADGVPILIHGYSYNDDHLLSAYLRAPKETSIERKDFTASYNADNQISAWNWLGEDSVSVTPVYDTDGNMTYGPVGENTASDYIYDVRNRLLSCNGVVYTYDAEDNRSSLTTVDSDANIVRYNYVYNRTSELSEVLIRNKTVTVNGVETTVSTYYVYGLGLEYEVTFDDNNESDVKYYHPDQAGSTVALTDADSQIIDTYSYDTWGYVKHTQGTSDTPFLYVGAFGVQTDVNGLINMRARYYNPTTQTFINADPLGFGGGMNWYGYASGDPLTRIDANGMYDGSVGNYSNPYSYVNNGANYGANYFVNMYKPSSLDVAQNVLSGLGMMPGVGAIFDVVNAGISLSRGNPMQAASHMISALPGIGDAYATLKTVAVVGAGVGVAALTKTAIKTYRSSSTTAKTSNLADHILSAERVGSGLKSDAYHRGASFLSKSQLEAGTVFTIKNNKNEPFQLLQTNGGMNGTDGIFEYIYDPRKNIVTHQLFIPNGKITGYPNQKL